MTLEITHCQKLKAPAEGGNRSDSDSNRIPVPRELWILLHAPEPESVVGVEETPNLVRLPTISVDSATYQAYLKTLTINSEDKKVVNARPTHCQCISWREGNNRLWLVFAADSKSNRRHSLTLAILEETNLGEYMASVQAATSAIVIDIEEQSKLPRQYKDLTHIPTARVATSEYKAWLIWKDLNLNNLSRVGQQAGGEGGGDSV